MLQPCSDLLWRKAVQSKVVPCGLEPRILRVSATRSNQLSYETSCIRNISHSGFWSDKDYLHAATTSFIRQGLCLFCKGYVYYPRIVNLVVSRLCCKDPFYSERSFFILKGLLLLCKVVFAFWKELSLLLVMRGFILFCDEFCLLCKALPVAQHPFMTSAQHAGGRKPNPGWVYCRGGSGCPCGHCSY